MAMNREDRRALKKKLAPLAKEIVALEKQIKSGINTQDAEAQIEELVGKLNLVEMMALEDYIASKELL